MPCSRARKATTSASVRAPAAEARSTSTFASASTSAGSSPCFTATRSAASRSSASCTATACRRTTCRRDASRRPVRVQTLGPPLTAGAPPVRSAVPAPPLAPPASPAPAAAAAGPGWHRRADSGAHGVVGSFIALAKVATAVRRAPCHAGPQGPTAADRAEPADPARHDAPAPAAGGGAPPVHRH